MLLCGLITGGFGEVCKSWGMLVLRPRHLQGLDHRYSDTKPSITVAN